MTARLPRLPSLPPRPRRRRFGLWLALGWFALAASAQDTPEADYELGLARMNSGDIAAAITQFQRVIAQDAAHLPARIGLGTARLRLGDAAGADKELRLALSLGAAESAIFPLLGNALLAERQYTVLLDTIKHPGDRAADSFEIAVLRGRAHFELGHLDAAREEFDRAATLAPERAEPLLGQALVAAAQSRLDDALAKVERALVVAPDNVEAWFRKGEILRERGNDDDALGAYDAALQRDPNALRARLARAGVNLKLGAREAALADVEFVRRRRPEDLSAAFLRWQIYQRAGDTGSAAALADVSGKLSQYADETIAGEPLLLRIAALVRYANADLQRADSYLERYIEQRPNDLDMRRLRGKVLLALGQAKDAATLLTPLARQDPHNLDILRPLGEACLETGHYSEAEAIFTEIQKLAPGDAPALTSLALARVGLGNIDGAQTGLAEATADRQGGRAAPMLLTVLQLKAGERQRALATIEALAGHEAKDPRVLNLLGVARAANDDEEGARAAFTRAMDAAPDFTPASYNLARLEQRAGDSAAARARLEALVARDAGATDALMALADLALGAGDRAAAVRWLEKAVTAQPDALDAQAQLVALKIALGQTDEALASASRMVDKHPENALAVETLADAQAAGNHPDQARRHYRDAARYAGFDGAQLLRIARQQAELGDDDEARRTLRKALNSPASDAARTALVRLDIQRGEYTGANAAIAALRTDRAALANILSGELELARGDSAAAVRAYRDAQSAAPGSEGAIGLANALLAGGDAAGAARELEQWTAAHGDDTEAGQALALLYLRLGRLDEARRLHEQLLVALPDNAQLNANLARLYQLGADKRARATAQRALELAPESPLALDTLGWIMVTEGDARGGLELLRNALSRDANPLTRYHLAQALNELGRGAEARTELRRILKAGQPAELVADVQRYYDALPAQ